MTPVRFKAARLQQKDLISTFPGQLGNLESDIASLFGFTKDSNIAESPLLLSNDGKVTKPQLRFYAAADGGFTPTTSSSAPSSGGIGYKIKDSGTGGTYGTICLESDRVTPAIVIRGGSTFTSLFSVAAADGAMTGSVTQDGTQTPLIPPASDSTLYYNQLGQWSNPSSSPDFFGTVFTGSAVEVLPSSSASLDFWHNANANDQEAGGPFANPISALWNPGANPEQLKIPFFGGGQPTVWMLFCSIPVLAEDPSKGLDCDVELYKDGVSIMKQKLYHAGSDQPYETVGRIANMQTEVSCGNGHYFEVFVTNNSADTSIICNPDAGSYLPIAGTGDTGRFGLVAIG